MLHRSISRRFLWLRLLRGSLVAGALYDLAFAVLMVAAPGLPARWLSLPLPGEKFYLWLIAVLLGILALLYLAAARDPRRYSAIIMAAILGRAAGAAALGIAASSRPDLAGLWPLAAADLGFAFLHAVSWTPLRA
jgi:hypothetical protein